MEHPVDIGDRFLSEGAGHLSDDAAAGLRELLRIWNTPTPREAPTPARPVPDRGRPGRDRADLGRDFRAGAEGGAAGGAGGGAG